MAILIYKHSCESRRQVNDIVRFSVGDTIRMNHYSTMPSGRKRVWKVIGQHLGATAQEGTYSLRPLDVTDNEPIHVPCIILETHPGIERV